MTTFADLVNDVMLTMEGYGLDQPRTAYLTGAGVTASGLSFTVDSVANLSEGLAEIGDELVYIRSINDGTNTVTLAPDGRGFRGTTAVTHGVDSRITMNPVLPRGLVKRKINETIVGTWPVAWAEATTTVTYNSADVGYGLPADVEEVVSVDAEDPGPAKSWGPVRRWRLETAADTTDFATGKAIFIYSDIYASGVVRVRYRKQPTELVNDADLLTASGLRTTARSVIVAGAVWRLVSSMDISRLKVNTVAMDMIDERQPVGSATQLAGYLRRVYERELLDEQQRLQLATPPIIHFTG